MGDIGTRKLKLTINGNDYTAEVSKAVVTSGASSSDFISFADADSGGGRDYAVTITLKQDAAAGSLWSEIFDNAGADVPYVVMPYGNATPSVSQPHFTGTCTITEPDGDFLGTQANASTTARATIDVSFPTVDGRPTKVTS